MASAKIGDACCFEDLSIPSQVTSRQWVVHLPDYTSFTPSMFIRDYNSCHDAFPNLHFNDAIPTRTGKWLLFFDAKELLEGNMTQHDCAWEMVKGLVQDFGTGIISAKCTTAWRGKYNGEPGYPNGAICCYTSDYENKREVKMAADAIRRVLYYPSEMHYKSDEDTCAKRYVHLGGSYVSLYKHTLENELMKRNEVVKYKWDLVEI